MKTERGGELPERNVEAAARLAELSMENTCNVLALLAELAHTLVHESRACAAALAAAGDAQDVMSQRTEHAQRTMRLMTAGAQKVAAIDSESRTKFSRLLTEQLVSGNNDLMDAFQAYFKVLPNRHAGVAEAVERAVSRSHTALGQVAAVAAAARDGARQTEQNSRMAAAQCRRAPAAGVPSASRSAEPRAY